jgi:hypothetical protein
MSFLSDLGDQLNSQFSLGENTNTSLDAIIDGQQVKYGALGDFASMFDQSARRSYVEEGYLRRDPYNTDPKQFEVLWQEPNATILVKKRMFSSIAENYRPDFMDSDEKLYYKALRILFQNKCTQISALEKLSKIQKITSAVGNVSDQLVPWIISLTDLASSGLPSGANLFGALGGTTNPFTTQSGSSFLSTVDRLRALYAYNQTNPYTTWITDPTNLFQSIFATGTGVIELTNFTSIDTSVSVDIRSPGNFSFRIADPYEAMLITDYDIEVALSDATNLFYNSKAFQFGVVSANQVIADQQAQLNQIRQARNASPITIKVDPDTLLSRRVTAIIDRLGVTIPFTYNPLGQLSLGANSGIEVPDDYLRGGNVAGYDGLDSSRQSNIPGTNIRALSGTSELQAFQTIISTIYNQLSLMANSAGNFTANNKSYNYARKKLRFNFSGKLIIQPMDVAHIYMSSKSQSDNKILSGLSQMFSGFGILQNINNTLTAITNATDILFNPSNNVAVQAEKAMFVGPSFPSSLWALMRGQFVVEKEGTHVCAGVIENASDNWSDGKFTIEVSGQDNTYYFRQGKVNFKPGADAFNGLIFDPLTPFKSNFDSVTTNAVPDTLELLDENKFLLGTSGQTSMVKYKLGSLAGEKATSGNYIQDQSIDPTTGRLTRVFYAPDGLVYKWKQGIGVFTQAGSISNINDPNLVGSPNIYQEPFAGLDVMNVLSLLITGIPYNFATYYKSTQNLNGFTGDPQSSQSSSYSFINSLRKTLTKNNTLWGNFIPFKNLTMNNAAIAQAMQAQFTVANLNSDLDRKLKKLQDLQNEATALGAVNALGTKIPDVQDPTLAGHIKNVSAQIDAVQESINNSIAAVQNATTTFFSQLDMHYAYDSNQLIDGKGNSADDTARQILRKQTNYLTRRMSYNVRANSDKNLLIVDDYYDIDYDIAAFNKALAKGIELYSTQYDNISTQIQNVADLLNLEVFADTQGHIRIRPPQYNKMPSSVFYRMIYLKQALGVQVFPQFLNDLFTDQLKSLKNRIEIIEDQIRLDCAILGQYPSIDDTSDAAAAAFLGGIQVTQGMGGTFNFVSSSNGSITDIGNLVNQANQEAAEGSVGQGLTDYDKIVNGGTATKQLFGNSERYVALFRVLNKQLLSQNGVSVSDIPATSIFQDSTVQSLITRIQTKSGQFITSQDYLTSAGPNQPLEVDSGQTIDFFKVTEELSTKVQEWQAAIKLFYHTVKNTAEFKSLDDDTTTSNSLLNPGLFNNSYIPEVYEHMIEDESYDDYGPGSGTRYVIKRSQIKNIRIAENAPPYTSIEAHGTLPFFKENEGPPGLNSFPNGGNALVTALAIDYDMWRNYGYKDAHVVNVPFLSDPATQLGPYAAMVLTRNRSNILRGTLTITGNEYMQPGEVIYLEDRNLLFYVNSVRHSFQEGSGFTTSMDLTYGHSIGEYIPTYVDTIGKLIYKNQEAASTIIQRQDSSAPEENLGVIQLDGKNPTANAIATGQSGSNTNQTSNFATTNATVVNNILYNTLYMINSNNTEGNNVQASVQLRLYYDDSKGGVDFNLASVASQVKSLLINPQPGPTSLATTNQPTQNIGLPDGSVNIVTVNIDDPNDRRSPSQKAIDAARNQMATVSTSTGFASPSSPVGNDDGTDVASLAANNNALRTALFSYIIDCWVSFTTLPPQVSSNSSADPGF